MDRAQDYDVLLTELKAAAVDVACQRALGRGAEVVFVHNRARALDEDVDLATEIAGAIALAVERRQRR
jgi:predicted GTPase